MINKFLVTLSFNCGQYFLFKLSEAFTNILQHQRDCFRISRTERVSLGKCTYARPLGMPRVNCRSSWQNSALIWTCMRRIGVQRDVRRYDDCPRLSKRTEYLDTRYRGTHQCALRWRFMSSLMLTWETNVLVNEQSVVAVVEFLFVKQLLSRRHSLRLSTARLLERSHAYHISRVT